MTILSKFRGRVGAMLVVSLGLGTIGWNGRAWAQEVGRDSRLSALQLSALQQRVVRLQSSVQRVESIRAIKRLQNAYGHYAEPGLWNDFADLFADDAVASAGSSVWMKAGCIRTSCSSR